MRKKILITGSGGYIGSITTNAFLKKGYKVIGVDNFSSGFRQPLEQLQKDFGNSHFRFYEYNLLDNLNPLFEKEREIDAVIHFAGNCSVDESIKNPAKYFTNNVCASQNLLQTMIKNNIKNIVFSSTCAVYGETQKIVTENHPLVPTNPYGESKKMVEDILAWYGKLSNINYVVLRYFNVCGASEEGNYGDSKKPSVHLIQNAVRCAMDIEPLYLTCPRVDTPDKTPIRDYVNVVDLADAHAKALSYLFREKNSEIFNLGSGKGNSVLEIIQQVENITGKKIPFTSNSTRDGEYSSMVASYNKAEKILGWKPKRSLEKSILSSVLWYTHHPQGWEF